MAQLDFQELHGELSREFFHYADQKGRSWLDAIMLMYWRARGSILVGAAANQPGSKFLITTDDASALPEMVRKGLMLADHVIIRHNHHLPITGLILDAIPDDFAGLGPLAWIERNRDRLPDSATLPHYRSAPPPEALKPFTDWLCTDGRPWFEKGLVTYVPVLLPAEVEAAMLMEGVNMGSLFAGANVLPQEHRLIDARAASALADLQIPFVQSLSASLLHEFRNEEHEALERFRTHLLTLLTRVKAETGSPEFSKDIENAALDLEEEVRIVKELLSRHATTRPWRRLQTEVLTLSALVCFYVGVPVAGVTALTAAAIDMAKSIKENFEERFSIKQNPVYFLARLGNAREKGCTLKQMVRKQ